MNLEALSTGLDRLYPNPQCALDHKDAYELLVATILSAQSTDVRVNLVTPALFSRYPDPTALSRAVPAELIVFMRSVGLFNNKAAALIGMASQLVESHAGLVPDRMDALIALPGVARKTANVVLQNIWNRNEGFVVDTHVSRLAQRLGLTTETKAERIERDLMSTFAVALWARRSHQLILHGREVCDARRPACDRCALFDVCPRVGLST